GYYVNLHTADFPGGAIRGQLAAETPDTALPVGGSGSLPMLGALLLIIAAALGLRVTRVAATRD
ncbi:MAG TPA: CHRD domain-containing protein, partial [Candidatus Limnocylindria bacterium]